MLPIKAHMISGKLDKDARVFAAKMLDLELNIPLALQERRKDLVHRIVEERRERRSGSHLLARTAIACVRATQCRKVVRLEILNKGRTHGVGETEHAQQGER